jgi:hypothetical protein
LGCLELRVPVDDTADQTFFNVAFGAAQDFSGGTATFRIRTLVQADGVGVTGIATDNSGFSFAQGAFVSLNSTNGFADDDTFADVEFDLGALTVDGAFDKTGVIALGFALGAPGFDDSFDRLTVFIDSITFSGVGGLANITFTNSAEGFVINTAVEAAGSAIIPHFE